MTWTQKHQRRQTRLFWMINHHLISEYLAEHLDNLDNMFQRIRLKLLKTFCQDKISKKERG